MNSITQQQLNELNRRFYRERAEEFGATRQQHWPGWERVLELTDWSPQEQTRRVLDVGCGNGRFARFLLGEPDTFRLNYTGLDQSPELLAQAQRECRSDGENRLAWLAYEITSQNLESDLPDEEYDLVVAFGLLHHLPGYETRRDLLQALARRVGPGGLLAFTTWRFGESERFKQKTVPWSDYNRTAQDVIDSRELEPGDYLMSFGTDLETLRYCHACDDEEVESLVAALELDRVAHFKADGKSGDLNGYSVLRRSTV